MDVKNKKSCCAEHKILAVKVLLLALAVFLLCRFVVRIDLCKGNRMYPSLRDGDLVISSRLAAGYRTGDIAAYNDPGSGKLCYARIAAMPGQTVDINDQEEVLINGLIVAEFEFYKTSRPEGQGPEYPLTLGEDEYFLLNDCRQEEDDSRVFGPVNGSELISKVVFVIRRRGF